LSQAIPVLTLVFAVWLPGVLTARRLGRLAAFESIVVGLGIGVFLLPVFAFTASWLLRTNFSLLLLWGIGIGWCLILLIAGRLKRPK